ncbi:MAG: transcriptional regulator [Methanobacteriota archaeon]|nr:MAG: transcriptional regulator [Euryarchaeota archaeon]
MQKTKVKRRAVTANREQLILRVREDLAKCGFFVTEPHNLRSVSFDIIARRDDQLLILKMLSNIDSLSQSDADDMRVLASALGASPMIIGLHSSASELDDGILYTRFGLPILSEKSFETLMLEGIPPLVYAAPGGLYVRIDGETLRSAREARSISLGTLAEAAGVSRKAIQMYETGMGAMVEIAARIEEFLDEPIVVPLDPFDFTAEMAESLRILEVMDGANKEIFDMLREIGYTVLPTRRCPFDAFAREEELLLTGIGGDEKLVERKARVVGDLSRVTEKRSVIIVRTDSRIKTIEGTPLVSEDELRRADHTEDLMRLINRRERRAKK